MSEQKTPRGEWRLDYEELIEEVKRRKRKHWARILASEPPGPPAGRRPRDPEQEKILLERDKKRLEKLDQQYRMRRVPVE